MSVSKDELLTFFCIIKSIYEIYIRWIIFFFINCCFSCRFVGELTYIKLNIAFGENKVLSRLRFICIYQVGLVERQLQIKLN